MKKNKILILNWLIGLSACSTMWADPLPLPELAPPQAGTVSFCVKLQGDNHVLSMRKFTYTLSSLGASSTSAADHFRLEAGQRLYHADLDVTEPGLLKVEEINNANFNCTFQLPPKTRGIELIIHSPPGINDCAIRVFQSKQACLPG